MCCRGELEGEMDKVSKEKINGKIKVSIIIPSLNAGTYIRQCLDSVRIQTLSELEILCVDAGSTDETLAVIKNMRIWITEYD